MLDSAPSGACSSGDHQRHGEGPRDRPEGDQAGDESVRDAQSRPSLVHPQDECHVRELPGECVVPGQSGVGHALTVDVGHIGTLGRLPAAFALLAGPSYVHLAFGVPDDPVLRVPENASHRRAPSGTQLVCQ